MAYYPPEFVERIRLIKQLQEERFMPLKVIRELLESGTAAPSGCAPWSSSRTGSSSAPPPVSASACRVEEIEARYEVPHEVLDRLAELGVLTPTDDGYSPSDVQIVEAMSRFRAGGYDESIGFTVYDTLRYKQAMEALAAEEVRLLTERLAGHGARPGVRADRRRHRAAQRPALGAAHQGAARRAREPPRLGSSRP